MGPIPLTDSNLEDPVEFLNETEAKAAWCQRAINSVQGAFIAIHSGGRDCIQFSYLEHSTRTRMLMDCQAS
jgi:hypothetical protein